MKPDQIIVVALTFLTGMFAGAALYVTSFAPEFAADDVTEKSAIQIVGHMYGGCDRMGACPSFRLTDSGDYQLLANGERTEGKLSNKTAAVVMDMLTDYRLASHAAPVEKSDCNSFVDGVDYHYEITLENTRYILDTCETSLAYGSELQQTLLLVWDELNGTSEKAYPVILEEGLGGWFVKKFRGEI